ncbi:toxin YdaT family protein [Morganella morganii]|uniref:toxin YdaT family protein n=1 Tax=Morganella morganii TaxID=582 RepID=UPI003EB6A020
MEIDINLLRKEVGSWAAERGQEHVAIEISKAYFERNSYAKARLSPIEDEHECVNWKAINNNRQQIFRWLHSDSKAAKAKFYELVPSIMETLPTKYRLRLERGSLNSLISIAIKEFAEAITETLLDGRDMSRQITNAVVALNAIQIRA